MTNQILKELMIKYGFKSPDMTVTEFVEDILSDAQSEPHYDEWCTDCKEYDHERHCCPRWNRVIRETLKDAQPEQRWIPVSERLPEDEYVLISKIPTKISGSKWSVTIAIRTADSRSRKIQWRDSGFGVIQDDKVLAWMPLPEPYQAERRKE